MLFNSYSFFIFFICLFTLYRLDVFSWQAKKRLLILASYLFYAAWNAPFVLLIWLSTLVDWFAARFIAASNHKGKRRILLLTSLVVNLGLLGFFKYGDFLLQQSVQLLAVFGIHYQPLPWSWILPVGISFYTFQTLSYTLDVYFRRLEPAKSFTDYALYVTFFPQLVAGPIVRASTFLPQCVKQPKVSSNQVYWGMCLLIIGLFEKTVLADAWFAPLVEQGYVLDASVNAGIAWAATFAFAGQIFCDFSGYSLAAIGVAMCFGFALPDNFRFPYAAVGFSDFWQRWHISLSSWLRDYLYIPLGGSRKGRARTSINLMLTMLLGGFWHGASWNFILWGGLHGVYLMLEHGLSRVRALAWVSNLKAGRLFLLLATFILVSIAWVFFRAENVTQAFQLLAIMFYLSPGDADTLLKPSQVLVGYGFIAILVLGHWWMRERTLESVFDKIPNMLRLVLFSLMLYAILTMAGQERAFIYFQF